MMRGIEEMPGFWMVALAFILGLVYLLAGLHEAPPHEAQAEQASPAVSTPVQEVQAPQAQQARPDTSMTDISVPTGPMQAKEFTLRDGTVCVAVITSYNSHVALSCGWGQHPPVKE